MAPAYPGELARRLCAARMRKELSSYRPAEPLALRDELRLRGMAARCGVCRACPGMVAALSPWSAEAAGPSPAPLMLRRVG